MVSALPLEDQRERPTCTKAIKEEAGSQGRQNVEKCSTRAKKNHQPLNFVGCMQRPLYQSQWHS